MRPSWATAAWYSTVVAEKGVLYVQTQQQNVFARNKSRVGETVDVIVERPAGQIVPTDERSCVRDPLVDQDDDRRVSGEELVEGVTGDEDSGQDPRVRLIVERQPQGTRPQRHGAGRRMRLVVEQRQVLALVRRSGAAGRLRRCVVQREIPLLRTTVTNEARDTSAWFAVSSRVRKAPGTMARLIAGSTSVSAQPGVPGPPGTAALRIVADDETGELESATILGRFGEVPDDFAESLQAA